VRVRDVLALDCLRGATVVAGQGGVEREVRWVHVIDNPDTVTWARRGQFLLSTGYAWPRDDDALRALFDELAATGVTAVGLAVPQFFDHFPPALLAAGDDTPMVLVEVPWEVPFAQITEEVHTILLGEQGRMIERSEAIHRALTRAAATASSLQAVARTLAVETGHRVLITAADGQPLAYAGLADERPDPTVLAEIAASVPQALTSARKGTAAAAALPVTVVPGVDWVVASPVLVQGFEAGTLWLMGQGTGPGALEHRAAEHGALVAALHLSHQRELATVESRLRRSYVDDLLAGRVEASDEESERGHVVGFSARSAYRVGLAELGLERPLGREGFARREEALERVRRMLASKGAADLVTTTSNRLYVLLPPQIPATDVWHALDDADAAMAVSRSHHGVDGVRRGAEEARASIRHVPRGRFAEYHELLLPRAVSGDLGAQRALVAELSEPLAAVRGGERLVATLFALAAHDFVLKTTADTLGVHISTLRHRVERIEDLLGLDLHDPEVRLRARIAGYVRDLEPLRPT
jgi:PucR family transcriptional regulator, purine catabolism regulatory protein